MTCKHCEKSIVFYAGKWCHKEMVSGRELMFTTCTIFPDEKGNWFFATPNLTSTEVFKALKNAISTNSLP